jgi:hypothetical protein
MRKASRTALALLVPCLIAAGVLAEGEADEAQTATFTVEQTRLELGDVKAGDMAEAVFRFHNAGDAEVRILRAKPS